MASTPTVYRSDDTSAPTLTRELNSYSDLLEAILVDGYGAKSGAGWTTEFTATGKKVFRNDTTNGTGVYLRVDDSATISNYYGLAKVNLFETVADIDNGTGPCPKSSTDPAIQSDQAWFEFYPTSTSTSTTDFPWICVADDRTFYFSASANNTDTGPTGTPNFFKGAVAYNTDVMHMWAGDFDSYLNTDGYASFISVFNSQTGSTAPLCASAIWSMDAGNSSYGYLYNWVLRGVDRATNGVNVTPQVVHTMDSYFPGLEALQNVGIRDNLSNDYTSDMNSQYRFYPVPMTEYLAADQFVIRGVFRGLLNGAFNGYTSGYNYSGETRTAGSSDVLGIRADISYGFWIDVTTGSWS